MDESDTDGAEDRDVMRTEVDGGGRCMLSYDSYGIPTYITILGRLSQLGQTWVSLTSCTA